MDVILPHIRKGFGKGRKLISNRKELLLTIIFDKFPQHLLLHETKT